MGAVNIARPLLKLDEVATALGVSRRTINSYVVDGKLPAVRVSTRCVRVRPEALEAFLDERRTPDDHPVVPPAVKPQSARSRTASKAHSGRGGGQGGARGINLRRPVWTRDGVRHQVKYWHVSAAVAGKRRSATTRCADRRVAEIRARRLVAAWEREAAGLTDAKGDRLLLPIKEHRDAFAESLRGRVSQAHEKDVLKCLDAYLDEVGPKTLAELNAKKAEAWIEGFRHAGLGARALNGRLRTIRQFARWCVRTRRLDNDPFIHIKRQDEERGRRRERRVLSPEEVQRLIAAPTRRHEGGRAYVQEGARARGVAYTLAAGAGLRRAELQKAVWRDADLDGAWLTIPLPKGDRDQGVPLPKPLVDALKRLKPEGVDPDRRIFPRGMPGMRTFRRDLEAAEIPYKDSAGRVVDFHALRETFIAALVRQGLDPTTVQDLARFSRGQYARIRYTKLHRDGLLKAAEAVSAPAADPAPQASREEEEPGHAGEGEFLSLREVARLHSVSKQTVRARIKEGALKAAQGGVGNAWRVPKDELERYVATYGPLKKKGFPLSSKKRRAPRKPRPLDPQALGGVIVGVMREAKEVWWTQGEIWWSTMQMARVVEPRAAGRKCDQTVMCVLMDRLVGRGYLRVRERAGRREYALKQ